MNCLIRLFRLCARKQGGDMGEYARDYILQKHGIDIGDDDNEKAQSNVRRYGCGCGRMFKSEHALDQHQSATGHEKTKRQKAGLP